MTLTPEQLLILQAKVDKLKAGDNIKATYVYGDGEVGIYSGKLRGWTVEPNTLYFVYSQLSVRHSRREPSIFLTDVELLQMSEPPVGKYVRSALRNKLFEHTYTYIWRTIGATNPYSWEDIILYYPDVVLCEVRDV